MVAACWSPATPRIGMAAPRTPLVGDAELGGAVLHLGQHRAGDIEHGEERVVPFAPVDVEEQRARGIGGVGDVDAAAGQPPDQIRIDRAEAQIAAHRFRAGAFHVIEQPGELGAGEIGIEQEAARGGDLRLAAGGAERRAEIGGAAILPDNGRMDRLAGLAIPHHHRLALVGDADGGDIGRLEPGLANCASAGGDHRAPDLLGIVLDPAGFGEILGKLALRHAGDAELAIEDDGARGRRALVDGENVVGHISDQGGSATGARPAPGLEAVGDDPIRA